MDPASPPGEILPAQAILPVTGQADLLLRAEQAANRTEALTLLSQASSQGTIDPEHHQRAHSLLHSLLKTDPRLVYQKEDGQTYQVLTGEQITLVIRKDRQPDEEFTASWSPLLRLTYLCLCLAFTGLMLAGFGALLYAPLAVFFALALNIRPTSRQVRIHSLILVMLASGLWLIGLLLGSIFVMHLV
jgi:hypothetical protein